MLVELAQQRLLDEVLHSFQERPGLRRLHVPNFVGFGVAAEYGFKVVYGNEREGAAQEVKQFSSVKPLEHLPGSVVIDLCELRPGR